MMTWLFSRLMSYFTVIEFMDYLAEFSARRLVTFRPYLTPSQYVEIVDETIPPMGLLIYECILLAVLLGLLMLAVKIFSSKTFAFSKVLPIYGNILFCMGAAGLFSRLLTFLSLTWFFSGEFAAYTAFPISCIRDALYLLLGILLVVKSKNLRSGSKPEQHAAILSQREPNAGTNRDDVVLLSGAANVQPGRTVKPGVRYCPNCGKQIQLPDEKHSDGNRQAPAVAAIVIAVVCVASLIGNVVLYAQNTKLNSRNEELNLVITQTQEEVESLRKIEEGLNKKIDGYVEDILTLRKDKEALTAEKEAMLRVRDFFDRYIALVADDNTKLYHTYDCVYFQNCDSYWAYNISAAEGKGYKPCPECH